MSAGYDAAIGCPEGEMEVTPACYGHLTHMLSSLAGGKLVVVLEVLQLFLIFQVCKSRIKMLCLFIDYIFHSTVHVCREATA